jgi:UDP-2,3-diacylglucosamine pyrophosphatase LpxH
MSKMKKRLFRRRGGLPQPGVPVPWLDVAGGQPGGDVPGTTRPDVRTVFVSDVHLGYFGCRARYLRHFLESVNSSTIVLGGDIIDLWALRKGFYWPPEHQDVLRTLLAKARAGTRVVFVPGNHDELFRDLCGYTFGDFEVCRDYLHETADGRRLLVIHGDEFDESVRYGAVARWVGGHFYDYLLWTQHKVHSLRHRLGYGYWSMADWLKQQAPSARALIARFEGSAAALARHRGADGVICGHIHHAEMRDIDGILYCNMGDWVESCTALVEGLDGRLSVVRWTERSEVVRHAEPALGSAA